MTRIGIVGGGIAGLALAAALDPKHQVTVYDSHKGSGDLGTAVGITPAAKQALLQLGCEPALNAYSGHVPTAPVYDIAGAKLAEHPDSGLELMARSLLREALFRALPASVEFRRESIASPDSLPHDIIVGADGVGSVVRRFVSGSANDFTPTGYVALRGVSLGEPPKSVIGEYWGVGRMFGMMPMRGDMGYWFASHRSRLAGDLSRAAVLTEARRVFNDAAPIARGMIYAAGDEAVVSHISVAKPLRRYVKDRFIVIGDAAHASTPHLGRGASDAITDAVTLAAALNAENPAKLNDWQRERLAVTQRIRRSSSMFTKLAMSDHVGFLRNDLVRRATATIS